MKVQTLKKNQLPYKSLHLIGARYFDKYGIPFDVANENGKEFADVAAEYLADMAKELLKEENAQPE